MQRLVLSVVIVVIILVMGCVTVGYINYQNARLLGQVDKILQKYNENIDPSSDINILKNDFSKYSKCLLAFIERERISEITLSIERLLPMFLEESDEFTAELVAIKVHADEILKSEIPYWYNIL